MQILMCLQSRYCTHCITRFDILRRSFNCAICCNKHSFRDQEADWVTRRQNHKPKYKYQTKKTESYYYISWHRPTCTRNWGGLHLSWTKTSLTEGFHGSAQPQKEKAGRTRDIDDSHLFPRPFLDQLSKKNPATWPNWTESPHPLHHIWKLARILFLKHCEFWICPR
jgi:hypothetical protein